MYKNENVLLILYRCDARKEKEADKIKEEGEEEQEEQKKQKVSHIGHKAEFTSPSLSNGFVSRFIRKKLEGFLSSGKSVNQNKKIC